MAAYTLSYLRPGRVMIEGTTGKTVSILRKKRSRDGIPVYEVTDNGLLHWKVPRDKLLTLGEHTRLSLTQ